MHMTAEYFMVLGLLGVAFFAVAGALLGYEKNISGFGVVVVATVTALGGGTRVHARAHEMSSHDRHATLP